MSDNNYTTTTVNIPTTIPRINRQELLSSTELITETSETNLISRVGGESNNMTPQPGYCIKLDYSVNPNIKFKLDNIPNYDDLKIWVESNGAIYTPTIGDDNYITIEIEDVTEIYYIAFYTQDTTTQTLVGLYTCEESRGNILYDTIGGNHITIEDITSEDSLRITSSNKKMFDENFNLSKNGTWLNKVGYYIDENGTFIPRQCNNVVTCDKIAALIFKCTEVFSVSTENAAWDGVVEYSIDNSKWIEWDGSATPSSNILFLRGTGNTRMSTVTSSTSVDTYTKFVFDTEGWVSALGVLEHILDYQTVANGELPTADSFCYCRLFSGATRLIQSPEISLSTLPWSGCYYTFTSCYFLMNVGNIAAEYVGQNAMMFMFGYNKRLKKVDLNIKTFTGNYCCQNMFSYSTLKIPPTLNVTNITQSALSYMFRYSGIKVSETETGNYTYPWRIPATGEITTAGTNWNMDTLIGTGGTFTGDMELNKTYYLDIT